ncbi:hypothetical protein LIER_33284 [Lithospermum erythrorhizon]|uniref:Peptidase C14 caspase domain-containing protein n=1 Tax=Lithospermum erythrorhizon TaxID=34254 RepID=A0AAV3S1V3_LITER
MGSVSNTVTNRIMHQALPNLSNQIQAYQGLERTPAAPLAMGRKHAVLCGITYKGDPKSLKGCINDVMCMHNFLINKLGFSKSKVRLLTVHILFEPENNTEDEMDPSRIPTKKNIRKALRWLVKECQPGDSLVFHYSRHGSKVGDSNGDEVDGHDELLCPVDYETEGRILDDEFNETIVRPFLVGAGNFMWEDHRVRHAYKGSTGGTAISIRACDDHQTSGDTTQAFIGKANGALTYSFIKTLENKPKMTYGQLLITMRKEIHGAQEPQLSATSMFDIHAKNISI